MAVSKDSPKRRKSIAVASQNKPTVLPRSKRRPHSIVPGDRLSPFAKARRSLVPRKSILKTFTNILHNDNDTPESQSSSQPAYLPSSLDDTTNQSMDFTRDFQTRIHDNTTRKSFGGRRVSFAENVHVRLIENLKKDKENDSNNVQPPPASEPPQQVLRPPTNENDYPGAASGSRPRSSVRYSLGEDMDLTSIGPQVFFSPDDSMIADEELDFNDDDDNGMEITEVVRGELIRKRSLSMGQRPPLAQLPQEEQERDPLPSDDLEQSESYEEADSQALSDDPDLSEPMDFTMPLRRSKRPPAEQDELWHALRQATHSGDTPIDPEPSSDDADHGNVPYEGDEMDLDDAVQRLMRARASLPSVLAMHTPASAESIDNDSFSTEGSFEEQRDQTMNLSAVYGRLSIGSAMDESEVYGAIDVPMQSTPRHSLARRLQDPEPEQSVLPPPPKAPAFTVFQPPPSAPSAAAGPSRHQSALPVFTPLPPPTSPTKPKATPAPLSPAKAKQPAARTGFSAAFAPPVARPSPGKRPRPSTDDGYDHEMDKPSSAKRASLAGKWEAESVSVPSSKPQPRQLSPSKKAPFQAPAAPSSQRPSSSIRRPSGYFARRKSLGTALGSEPHEDKTPAAPTSPKKKAAGLGLGRASMGSGSADAWQRFDKNQVDEEKEEDHCDREVVRQATASSAITRGSPAPASPRSEPTAAPSQPPIADVSALVGSNEVEQSDDNIEIDATEQWRNGVEDNDYNEINDSPISIKEFFAMTGIKFMDDLTAPRRSTHPAQQSVPQPREPEEISLAEYVLAMGMDLPQLALFSRVSKDLEAWIEKSKADFIQAEDEAAKITPELFTEYSRADEEGQAELLHQLQLIRTNTRALAKSDWYDWKLQWLEGLRITADQTFHSLETDAKALEIISASAGDLIPALQQEYEDIMKELEKETAEVTEIEACDQEYLNELKASIAEQNIEVEALRAEVAESKAKLLSLQERLKEANTEKQETKAAIDDAQRILHIQTNGTRAEVFKLKAELESLEDLHMFRVTKVNAEEFEYVYASQFRVTIPCKNYVPVISRVDVVRMDMTRTRAKDNFPGLSDLLLRKAKEQIVHGEKRTTRQIIHRLSDYWSACAQLRAQLKLLLIKFPVTIQTIKDLHTETVSSGFKAKVMVVFPSVKAKAFISFVFGDNTFSYWPVTINTLEVEVEVAYGAIDGEVIAKAVIDRLSQVTPEDNYACLLDACIEAQEMY
ncbi:hypothetical protein C0991_008814 [Blastosporella zonata]|nr:hypothetical protein C0991_008814 [Blastosporella zonata]